MLIPKWLTITAWFIFLGAVYWPISRLIFDAIDPNTFLINSGISGNFFLSENQYSLLGRSVKLAAGATGLALVIGVPYAFFVQRIRIWGRWVFQSLYLFPLLIPPYMQTIVWSEIFAHEGWLNRIIMRLHIANSPFDIHNLMGAVFVLAFSYFPFITLLVESGLKNLDSGYEEMALLHGNWFKSLFFVTLPMIAPQVIAGGIFVFIFSIIDFGVPDLLRVKVYPVEIFIEYSAMYNERAAIMLAVPLLLLNSLLIAAGLWVMKDKSFINFSRSQKPFFLIKTGAGNIVAICYCSLIILISVVVPIICLVYMTGDLHSLEKAWIASANSIEFSLLLSIFAALAVVSVAFILAYSLTKTTGKLKLILDYLTQLPFAVPPILLGIGLIKVWNQPVTDWVYGSPTILIVGYLAHLIPFAIRVIYSGLQQIPSAFEEAGLLASNHWWSVQGIVILPMLGSSLLVAFVVVFSLSLADLGTSLLIMPAGSETIPIVIYNYLHYGATSLVAAFCLMLLFFQYSIWFGLTRLYKRVNVSGLT